MKAVTDPIAPNIFYTHFILDGTKVVAQYETDYYSSTPQGIIYFYYDESGSPTGMKYNGNVYFFQKNLQGDIIRILNTYGSIVATYTYDAWGNIIASTDTSGVSIGTKNPFRYRGYYYDTETGLYYLNSRYYDPQVGRFLNADGFVSTGQGLLGSNMFAYCLNNPVVYGDHMGSAAKNQLQRGLYDSEPNLVNKVIDTASDIYNDATAFIVDTKRRAVKLLNEAREFASETWKDIKDLASNVWDEVSTTVSEVATDAWVKTSTFVKDIYVSTKNKISNIDWNNVLKQTVFTGIAGGGSGALIGAATGTPAIPITGGLSIPAGAAAGATWGFLGGIVEGFVESLLCEIFK